MSVPASRNSWEAREEDGGWMEDGECSTAAFSPLCENESINSANPPHPSHPLPFFLPPSPPCACCLCLLARWFLLSCQRQHYHIPVAWETSAQRDNDLKPLWCLKLVNMKGYPRCSASWNPNVSQRVLLLECDFFFHPPLVGWEFSTHESNVALTSAFERWKRKV